MDVITAPEVERAASLGQRQISISAAAIMTPLARERAQALGIVITHSAVTGKNAGGLPGGRTGTRPIDETAVRRVVTQVLLQSMPGLFNPSVVREITGRVMARLARA